MKTVSSSCCVKRDLVEIQQKSMSYFDMRWTFVISLKCVVGRRENDYEGEAWMIGLYCVLEVSHLNYV